MLTVANSLRQLDFGKLMAVYEESNRENGEEFYSNLSPQEQLLQAEQDFYHYLRNGFFKEPGGAYYIWSEQGQYVSALRLEPYQDGLLLEALETAPEQRRKGYAALLVHVALGYAGNVRIYSHVGKGNAASLRTHEQCGFHRILNYAVYADGSVNDVCCTLCHEPEM